MIKKTIAISLFIMSSFFLFLGPSVTKISFSQMKEYIEKEENFSFVIPSDWEVVTKPENKSIDNEESSPAFLLNGEFPYYKLHDNTILALTLRGISEMDLDRHSYITISVKGLENFISNTSSNNDKSKIQSLENLSQSLENNLSEGFPPNVISKNSTITLDKQLAFQIIYEPLGCFCLEGNTITIHKGKLYDIYFHAGEFRVDKVLQDLNNITSSFRFLN